MVVASGTFGGESRCGGDNRAARVMPMAVTAPDLTIEIVSTTPQKPAPWKRGAGWFHIDRWSGGVRARQLPGAA